MTDAGVFAGANMPYQLIASSVMLGNPASAMVGTFGRNDARFAAVYASGFSFPDWNDPGFFVSLGPFAMAAAMRISVES